MLTPFTREESIVLFLAEVNSGIARLLNFYPPAGPLSGKTTMAVVVWLVAWAVTHQAWRDRDVNFGAVFGGSLLLMTQLPPAAFPFGAELSGLPVRSIAGVKRWSSGQLKGFGPGLKAP